MLEKLQVKNFAIIEDLSIEFTKGMNVITGETGAGKSLVIDTIQLLSGARADADMIRYNEKSAYILGVFSDLSSDLKKVLNRLEILNAEKITIEREIKGSSRNLIKVNGVSISLSELKEIGSHLLDVHVQHDLYRLFNSENYFDYLDTDNKKILELKNDYLMALNKYNESFINYKNILNSKKTNTEKLEYLQYEKKELEGYNLKIDEDIHLAQELNKLRNYDKIFTNLKEAYSLLDNEMYSLDNIYDASEHLSNIEKYESLYKDLSEKIKEAYYLLDEAKGSIYHELNSIDFDEASYAMLEERDFALTKLKEKYHRSLNDLIKYYDTICLEIEKITNYDGLLSDLHEKLNSNGKVLYDIGVKLHNERVILAQKLEENIVSECKMLDLPEMTFKVKFNDIPKYECENSSIFLANGLDNIDFLVSFNKGEPLRPLAKVASGGELSRVMLAFKSIFSSQKKLSLIVFDEIDTGVSGEAALMIAKKISAISKSTPVICITHLAQVAAIADTNYFIYKEEENERTKTFVKKLDLEEKIVKIAQMLSGNQLSSFAIMHAKELINKKNN